MADSREIIPLLDRYSETAGFGYSRRPIKLLLKAAGAGLNLFRRRKFGDSSCDILVLSPSESWFKRVQPFVASLERRHPRTRHIVVPNLKSIIRQRLLGEPFPGIGLQWRIPAAYAGYLFETYRPRVVITFTETDLISFFLKLEAERRTAQVVNIAHAVLTHSNLKSLFSFDYYFVLGKSSIDNARTHPIRFGSTRLVPTGSITIGMRDRLNPNPSARCLLLFSTWLYGGADAYSREFNACARRGFSILAEWARRQPQYRLLVKLHPEEHPGLAEEYFVGLDNVTLLPKTISIREALAAASISAGMMTNASIESAVMNRPYIDVFPRRFLPNYLDIESYFGPRVETAEELETRLSAILGDWDAALARARAFAQHHLAENDDTSELMVQHIGDILQQRPTFHFEELPAHLDQLTR